MRNKDGGRRKCVMFDYQSEIYIFFYVGRRFESLKQALPNRQHVMLTVCSAPLTLTRPW
jgi:hypothetical protein